MTKRSPNSNSTMSLGSLDKVSTGFRSDFLVGPLNIMILLGIFFRGLFALVGLVGYRRRALRYRGGWEAPDPAHPRGSAASGREERER